VVAVSVAGRSGNASGMETWVVGATIEDEASAKDASRLQDALAERRVTGLQVIPVGSGAIRVSFHVQAPTAREAEDRAVQILEGCSRYVGVEPTNVSATAR
jgi:hypothetical protein